MEHVFLISDACATFPTYMCARSGSSCRRAAFDGVWLRPFSFAASFAYHLAIATRLSARCWAGAFWPISLASYSAVAPRRWKNMASDQRQQRTMINRQKKRAPPFIIELRMIHSTTCISPPHQRFCPSPTMMISPISRWNSIKDSCRKIKNTREGNTTTTKSLLHCCVCPLIHLTRRRGRADDVSLFDSYLATIAGRREKNTSTINCHGFWLSLHHREFWLHDD